MRIAFRVLVFVLAGAVRSVAQEQCDVRITPLPLLTTTSGETAYVDAPEPVRVPGGLMLIGHGPFLTSHVYTRIPRTLLPHGVAGLGAEEPGGSWRRIEMPPGVRQFRWPQARSDGRVVHVIWGVGPDSSLLSPLGELWHSVLDSSGWSTPRMVLSAHQVVREDYSTQGAVLAADTLLLAVAADDSSTGRHIVVMRLAGGSWTTSRIPTDPFVSYASIGQVRGELLVAYVGRGPTDQNFALRVVRSSDSGRSWSSSTVVSPREDGGVTSPQFHRLDDSSLVLVWGQQRPGPFTPLSDSISLAVFRPGGRWQRHAGVAVPGRFWPLLATQGGGAIHAAVRVMEGEGLLYARWTGGSWCTTPVPASAAAFTRGSLLPWDGDSLLLFWGEHVDPYGYQPITRAAAVVPSGMPARR